VGSMRRLVWCVAFVGLLGAGWALHRVGDRSRRWAGALLMLLAVAALLGHAATDPMFCR